MHRSSQRTQALFIIAVVALLGLAAFVFGRPEKPRLIVGSQQEQRDGEPKRVPFLVRVYDSDYSLAYSRVHEINDTLATIRWIGGLVGDSTKVLYSERLSSQSRWDLLNALQQVSFDTLREKYADPYIADGQQLTIDLMLGGRAKQVHLANTFVPALAQLMAAINKAVPEQYKIRYRKM